MTPETLETIVNQYKESQLILSANQIGLFPAIGLEKKTISQLAEELNCSTRGLEILCNALVSIGVLSKQGHDYWNGEAAQAVLLPDSPQSKVALFNHNLALYQRWGRLYQSVKTGTEVPDEVIDPQLNRDEAAFAKAMFDAGKKGAEETALALPLEGCKTILDLGGGPGLYPIEICKQNPTVQVVLFDSENTLKIAKQKIESSGFAQQITCKPGDVFEDDIGRGYDLILLSNFVHIFSPENNQHIIQKCANALNPNGLLCVKDFILEDNKIEPQWAALFAVNMLVNTEGGNCYTVSEITEWMNAAGITFQESKTVAANSTLITGKKNQ